MPSRTEEDGTESFVIYADLLLAEGYLVDDVLRELFSDLATRRHGVVGWEQTADVSAGTGLTTELADDSDDEAVRSSLRGLAGSLRGVVRLELLAADAFGPHAWRA